MQMELTGSPQLLNDKNEVIAVGWGRGIQAGFSKPNLGFLTNNQVREWDTYYVQNKECRAVISLVGTKFGTSVFVEVMQISKRVTHVARYTKPFFLGSTVFPPTSKSGDIIFATSKMGVTLVKSATNRFIKSEILNFSEGVNFTASLTFDQSAQEGFTNAVPLSENRKQFFYNQKIGCMPVTGEIHFGGTAFQFTEKDSFGFLDWGRCVLPPQFQRTHCYAMGLVEDRPFAISLGLGYDDKSQVTENFMSFDGICHKLDRAHFEIPANNSSPWYLVTSDARVRLKFFPEVWSGNGTGFGGRGVQGAVVCGKYMGKVALDNGSVMDIDTLNGFACFEKHR